MDSAYIDPHQITLLHSKHLKESQSLPDLSGAVVTISDLQAHARYKRQLRHALKELALEWEANKKIVDAAEVAEAVVYQLLDPDDAMGTVMAHAILLNAAEWLMEAGEELEDIKELLDGLMTWQPI